MFKGFAASAHVPLIEALRHGGVQAGLRRSLTDFGSGWRGLIGITSSMAKYFNARQMVATVSPLTIAGVLVDPRLHLRALFGDTEARFLRKELVDAFRWSRKTGFHPTIIQKDIGLDFETLKATIRHERIHALHRKYGQSSWIRSKLAEAPDLLESVKTSVSREASRLGLQIDPAKRASQIVKHYQAKSSEMLELEKLAWANERNRSFFQEARRAGLTLPSAAAHVRYMNAGSSAAGLYGTTAAAQRGGSRRTSTAL